MSENEKAAEANHEKTLKTPDRKATGGSGTDFSKLSDKEFRAKVQARYGVRI